MKVTGTLNPSVLTEIECDDCAENRAPVRYVVMEKDSGRILTEIKFQDGPLRDSGLNGITNEDLIDVVVHRLLRFRSGKEYDIAITNLKQAQMWLNERSRRKGFVSTGEGNERTKRD